MKKIFFNVCLGLLFTALVPVPGFAGPLDWLSETSLKECPKGKLVINITHKVINDIDSGVADYWAIDKYGKTVKVRQTGVDTFCAVARYHGSFVTDDGPSPMDTDPDGILKGIKGVFEGGYRTTIFTGVLDPDPAEPRIGNLGTFDFDCDVDTGICTNRFDWVSTYFTSTEGFDLDWWGWIYRTPHNGVWTNACGGSAVCPGNSGDITD